jgi:sulfur-oxidizing protein SoxX
MRLPSAAALAALAALAAAAGDRAPVAYVVVDAAAIPAPLTDAPGDAARGAEAAADPLRGGCAGCHDGAAAPDRAAMAALPEGRLRLAIVDLAVLDPAAAEHAFYDIVPDEAGERVAETRLTAQEVEDVIAWLRAPGP